MADTRREALRRIGAAAVGTAVVSGTASADSGNKDNYVRFEARDSSVGDWRANGPDPDPNTVNFESGDNIDSVDDGWQGSGSVDGSFSPKYDEIEFDGDPSELSYDVDANVRVIVNGVTETDASPT